MSLGCAVVVLGLAGLACKGKKTDDTPAAASAAPAVTSAPPAETEEAPAVTAAPVKTAVPVAAKSPCKDPDDVLLGGKCLRKCKADMDCDGLNLDCLPFSASVPTKVCRKDDDDTTATPATAAAPAAPAAAPIPKGAVVANPDSFQFGGSKCPSGWTQVPSMNDALMCNRSCKGDADCHSGNSCSDGPMAGTKVCM